MSTHELPAEAEALEVGAQQDRVFAALVVRVGMEADRAHHLAALGIDRDEGDGAGVVDLRQAREEGVAEIAHRREEAQAQVLGRNPLEEVQEQLLVLRPDRTDENLAAVAERERALPFLGIGPDREARMAGPFALFADRRDGDARIDRDDAVLVGEERIDVELAHLRQIGGELRELHEDERDGLLVGGRHVAIGLEDARDARAAR